MRLSLLSSASVMGLIAAIGQTQAAPDMTGVLELSGGVGTTGQHNFFVGKGADDPYSFGGKAKGYWPLSPDIHLQIDLFAQQTNQLMVRHGGEGWPSTDAFADGAAIHLLHPLGEHARVGVAGSIWDNQVFDITNSSERVGVTYGLAAAEGQYFGMDWTLTGQAGYFGDMSCGNCFLALRDGEFIRGKARYYFGDNTALTGEALQMWGGFDDALFGNKSLQSTAFNLQVEHKLDASPFSGFLGVSYERTAVDHFGLTSSVDTTAFVFGFKFYYDQPTVRSNERTGPELDTPLFGNALPLAGPLAL